jgi:hypothetical protein
MNTHTHNQQLLHEICDLIPDPQRAALIREMDPYDHITFAEAYCAVRTLPTLTRDLRHRLLAEITALAELEKAHLLASTEEGSGAGRPFHVVRPDSASA